MGPQNSFLWLVLQSDVGEREVPQRPWDLDLWWFHGSELDFNLWRFIQPTSRVGRFPNWPEKVGIGIFLQSEVGRHCFSMPGEFEFWLVLQSGTGSGSLARDAATSLLWRGIQPGVGECEVASWSAKLDAGSGVFSEPGATRLAAMGQKPPPKSGWSVLVGR